MSVLSASNAYYAADVATFIGASAEEIFGRVAMASEFAVELTREQSRNVQLTPGSQVFVELQNLRVFSEDYSI